MARNFASASSQRIDLDTNVGNWEYTQAWTVSAWIYPLSNVGGKICGKELGSGNFTGWGLAQRGGTTNPTLQAYVTNTSGTASANAFTTSEVLTLNAWHFICVTYSGSGTVAGLNFYVDGTTTQALTTVTDNLAGATILNSVIAQIGARGGTASPGFYVNARLQRVLVYNRVLTGAEITTLRNGGAPPQTGLQLWHELATDGYQLTPDWSGNSHTGFLPPSPNAPTLVTNQTGQPAPVPNQWPSLGTSGGMTLGGPLVPNPANPILTNLGKTLGTLSLNTFGLGQQGPSAIIKVADGDYRQWLEAQGGGKTLDPTNQTGVYDQDTPTCYATSTDGTNWSLLGGTNPTGVLTVANVTTNPVNTPYLGAGGSLAWMRGESSVGRVILDGSTWKLWGHGGNNTGPRALYYATSTSVDGLSNWVIQNGGQPILQIGAPGSWEEKVVSDAKVLKGTSIAPYAMLYWGQNNANNLQLGLATSNDGLTWTKYAGNPVIALGTAPAWDSVNAGSGDWAYDATLGLFVCWYGGMPSSAQVSNPNPSGIGFAYSTDGKTWTKGKYNPVYCAVGGNGLEAAIATSLTVYLDGDTYRIFYRGDDGLSGGQGFRGRNEVFARRVLHPAAGGGSGTYGNWLLQG